VDLGGGLEISDAQGTSRLYGVACRRNGSRLSVRVLLKPNP